ncbi:MAG: DUF805 domain-containing protein [Candidatus Spyradenecus sp.]
MSEFDTFLQAIETRSKATPSKTQEKPQPTIDQQEMVYLSEAYSRFWSRWTFEGRASRSEYWWVYLINFFISVFLSRSIRFDLLDPLAFILTLAFVLITFIPQLCLTIQRLHDTGRSGWFVWIGLIPFLGPLILIVLMCLGSEPRENAYGPIPNTGTLTK